MALQGTGNVAQYWSAPFPLNIPAAGPRPLTISFWYRTTTTSSRDGIVGLAGTLASTATTIKPAVGVERGSSFNWSGYDAGSSSYFRNNVGAAAANVWQHFAATIPSNFPTAQTVYLNGVAQTDNDVASSWSTSSNLNFLTIGQCISAYLNAFEALTTTGLVAEVLVTLDTLPAANIKALAGGMSPLSLGLTAPFTYFPLRNDLRDYGPQRKILSPQGSATAIFSALHPPVTPPFTRPRLRSASVFAYNGTASTASVVYRNLSASTARVTSSASAAFNVRQAIIARMVSSASVAAHSSALASARSVASTPTALSVRQALLLRAASSLTAAAHSIVAGTTREVSTTPLVSDQREVGVTHPITTTPVTISTRMQVVLKSVAASVVAIVASVRVVAGFRSVSTQPAVAQISAIATRRAASIAPVVSDKRAVLVQHSVAATVVAASNRVAASLKAINAAVAAMVATQRAVGSVHVLASAAVVTRRLAVSVFRGASSAMAATSVRISVVAKLVQASSRSVALSARIASTPYVALVQAIATSNLIRHTVLAARLVASAPMAVSLLSVSVARAASVAVGVSVSRVQGVAVRLLITPVVSALHAFVAAVFWVQSVTSGRYIQIQANRRMAMLQADQRMAALQVEQRCVALQADQRAMAASADQRAVTLPADERRVICEADSRETEIE